LFVRQPEGRTLLKTPHLRFSEIDVHYGDAVTEPRALFEPDGADLSPTAAALGPWRPDALHGGAVSALLGQSFEQEGWVLARMTMDLMRRVPLQPLRLVPGPTSTTRRLLRQSVELWADERLVAKAEALLLPDLYLALPQQPDHRLGVPRELDTQEPDKYRAAIVRRVGYPSFVSHAVSMRNERPDERRPGVVVNWLKLLLPIIAGQEITPVQRATAAADYANGGFPTLPFEEWSFVSLDLTVQLTRQPEGEWVGVTCDSLAASTGIGLGDAELHDKEGRIGRSTTTLLVERR
jgi:Thioesterase-like superfamily